MKNNFMQSVVDAYNKVSAEIKEKPRVCAICGEVETMDNLMLKYDNGLIMCDYCAFEYYENEEKGKVF